MRRLLAIALTISVLQLVTAVPVSAKTTTVRCGRGADLQTAIDKARAGDTLVIRRTCVGQFDITKDLRLKGAGLKATLRGTNGAEASLVHIGPRAGVAIVDLLLTGNSLEGELGSGAGIHNEGTLRLIDSVVASNVAAACGGIHNSGALTIIDSVIRGNSAFEGKGGNICNVGRLVVEDSVIRDGYIQTFIGSLAGAGIHNSGTAIVRRTTIRDNWSGNHGGGIANIGELTLVASNVRDNASSGDGGGIWNATSRGSTGTLRIYRSRIHDNIAGQGAGIRNEGVLRLRRSKIYRNKADDTGGGIHNVGDLKRYRVSMWKNTPNDCTGC